MVINPNIERFRQLIIDAGLLPASSTASNELLHDYFSFFYRYVMDDAVITIDDEYASGGIKQIFEQKGPFSELKKELNVPPSFVLLQRITLGLMGLFADLNATANFRQIAEELWPFVSSPPSTPIGRDIADYRQQRGRRVPWASRRRSGLEPGPVCR
ncbi:MAG: hypothetical protein R2706_20615 [Acidimicrobiales bacterium]